MNLMMIRSIISSVTEGVIKRFSGAGRSGESFEDREVFQHYGFTSRALEGAEGIILKQGNHVILVASDDRRYRIVLADGEVALYTDEGDHIHLRRGRTVAINTRVLHITATEKVSMVTPLVETTGEIQAARDITSQMNIVDMVEAGGISMADMRLVYNAHTHSGDSGGTTSAPGSRM